MKLFKSFLTLICLCCLCFSTASADVREDKRAEENKLESFQLPSNESIEFLILGEEIVASCGGDISFIALDEEGNVVAEGESYPLLCSAKEIEVEGCVDATGDMTNDMAGACTNATSQAATQCPAENGNCARCTGNGYTKGTCKWNNTPPSAPEGACYDYRVVDGDDGQQVCATGKFKCNYKCKRS